MSIKIDSSKLNILKEEIEEKNMELFDSISGALASGDTDTYNHLKQMQLQCEAELRLIRYIEDGMVDKFIVC